MSKVKVRRTYDQITNEIADLMDDISSHYESEDDKNIERLNKALIYLNNVNEYILSIQMHNIKQGRLY